MTGTVAFRTAIRDALDEELSADERVILFGEDVAVAGGVFATTTGLYDKYGPERVFDTPISELALAGAADEPGRDDEGDQQRRQRRQADARRHVAEHVRAGDRLAQGVEKVEQHLQPSA